MIQTRSKFDHSAHLTPQPRSPRKKPMTTTKPSKPTKAAKTSKLRHAVSLPSTLIAVLKLATNASKAASGAIAIGIAVASDVLLGRGILPDLPRHLREDADYLLSTLRYDNDAVRETLGLPDADEDAPVIDDHSDPVSQTLDTSSAVTEASTLPSPADFDI